MKYSKNNKESRKKTIKIAGAMIGILLVLALILGLLHSCGADATMDSTSGGLIYDTASVEGGWDEADVDGIVASLNEKVEAGMINISMNTSPIFADGTSEGNLMIVNESVNNYPQIVEITRNDTGETVYKSGGIPVGSKIESAKLAVDLPAGQYECTAMFHNVDPDTGNSLGCAGAMIMITVQS